MDEPETTDEAPAPTEHGRLMPCSSVQMGILWQALSQRDLTKDVPKLGRIAGKIKRRMTIKKRYEWLPSGGFREYDDPVGDKVFADGKYMLPLVREEAETLEELLGELKALKLADQKTPALDGSVADEVDDLEQRCFPMWKATVPTVADDVPNLPRADDIPKLPHQEAT